MNWHGLRWPVVALAFAGSLLVIWGGQRLVHRYNYQVPLQQAVQADKSVVSFSVSDRSQCTVYEVKFQPGGNLEQQWQELNKIITARTGKRPYRIEPVDNPDATLNQVYYNCQYAVYDALARGTFQAMADQVQRQAGAAGVTAALWVDNQNVYLVLTDKGHSVEKIFPRPAASQTGGGVVNE